MVSRSRIGTTSIRHHFSAVCYLLLCPQEWCEVLRSACLYVCLSTVMSQKPYVQTPRNFPHVLPVAVGRSFSDNNATRYVLQVLWMTSRFHIIGQIQMQACSLRRSDLFTMTLQVTPLNCAPGAKSAIADCLLLCFVILQLLKREKIFHL